MSKPAHVASGIRGRRQRWVLAVLAWVAVALVVAGLVHVLRERQRVAHELEAGAQMRDRLLKHAEEARQAYESSTPPALRAAQQAQAMREFQAAEAAVRVNQALAAGDGAAALAAAGAGSAVAAVLPASRPAPDAGASQPLLPDIPVTAAALQATQRLAMEAAARRSAAAASAGQQKGRMEATPVRP